MHFIPDITNPAGDDIGLVQEEGQVRFSSPAGTGWVGLVGNQVVAGAGGAARIILTSRKRWFRRAATVEVVGRLGVRPARAFRKDDVVQAELGDWRGSWTYAPDGNLSPLGRRVAGLRGWMVAAFAILACGTVVDVLDGLVQMREESAKGAITSVVSRNASKLYPVTVEPFTHTYSPYLRALSKENREGGDLERFTREWIEKHGGAGKPVDAKDARAAE